MSRRRENAIRDVPGRPDLVQLDVLHGHWATIDRVDLDAVKAAGVWHVSFQSSYPVPRLQQPVTAVARNLPYDWEGPANGRSLRPRQNLAAFVLELHGQPRPIEEPHEPDHLNFDVKDNRLANLRWLPKIENRRRKRKKVTA